MNIFDIFKRVIHEAAVPTIFELGACDGVHTRLMVELLEATKKPYRYFAFEPSAKIVRSFKSTMGSLLPKITFTQAAVGAKEGEAIFYQSDSKYYGSSSLRPPTPALYQNWPTMRFKDDTVQVVTLDAFCSRHNVDGIDFIWSDIQGAEADMIAGGQFMLLNNTDWLYTECDGGLYEGDVNETQLLALLPGFKNLGRDEAGNLVLQRERR